jgi:hypothetical protein
MLPPFTRQDSWGNFRAISAKNAATRASASGSGSSSFTLRARPFEVAWMTRGTAISTGSAALAYGGAV